jgi:hypothetical protein
MVVRRVVSVLDFEFWPIRRAGGVLSWWPAAATALAAVVATVGVALPRQVGGMWLALVGAAAMCGIFFVATYRLHRQAAPDFPRHKLEIGHPWVADHPKAGALVGEDKLLIFDVAYYNREPQRRVNVELDVFWTREVGDRTLGPYKLSRHLGSLGRLTLFPRNADVGPQQHLEGAAAFEVWIPGVELGEQGSDFEPPEYIRLDVRVTDNISKAEHVEPLPVGVPSEKGDH